MTQPNFPEPNTFAPQPPPGATKLIGVGEKQVYTPWRTTDVRTAITRALKEYMEQLKIVWPGGRESKFAVVKETWASPEDPALYPGACIYALSPGSYDASAWSPKLTAFAKNTYLKKTAEFEIDLIIDIFCTDPAERMAVTAMLETAFNPTDFMYGFWLECPHYHNARVTFEPLSSEYLDDAGAAQQRKRIVQFGLFAVCEVLQLRGEVPPMQVITDVTTLEGIDVGTGQHVDEG